MSTHFSFCCRETGAGSISPPSTRFSETKTFTLSKLKLISSSAYNMSNFNQPWYIQLHHAKLSHFQLCLWKMDFFFLLCCIDDPPCKCLHVGQHIQPKQSNTVFPLKSHLPIWWMSKIHTPFSSGLVSTSSWKKNLTLAGCTTLFTSRSNYSSRLAISEVVPWKATMA